MDNLNPVQCRIHDALVIVGYFSGQRFADLRSSVYAPITGRGVHSQCRRYQTPAVAPQQDRPPV